MREQKPKASVFILEKAGGWIIRAVDEYFGITLEEPLPANYSALPRDKQRYWANRRLEYMAKQMSKLVAERPVFVRGNGKPDEASRDDGSIPSPRNSGQIIGNG